MTISTTASRVEYAGNGVTTVFPIPFRFLENAHIVALLVSAAGVSTSWALSTNYTLAGADADGGGTLTALVAPAVGTRLVIYRDVPATQETDYISGDPFPAESHERALDKLTMLAQQDEESLDRAIKLPVSDAGVNTTLPVASLRLDRLLSFDAATGAPEVSDFTHTQVASAIAAAYSGAVGPLDALSFIQEGAGAVSESAQDKARERFSVFDYMTDAEKADTQLTTPLLDHTAAVQLADTRATAAGRTLRFNDGTFNISNVGVTRGGCAWVGEDAARVKVRAMAQAYPSMGGVVTASGFTNLLTSGITFDMTAGIFGSSLYYGLRLLSCVRPLVTCCRFVGIQDKVLGIALAGGSAPSILYNYFENLSPSGNQSQAINVSNSAGNITDARVIGNEMIGTGLYADCTRGLFALNKVRGWQFGSGLTFGPSPTTTDLLIIGNECFDSSGIDVNAFYPCGIELWGYRCTVQANRCGKNSGGGILVGGSHHVVSGNTCFNNGQSHPGNIAGIMAYTAVDGADTYTFSESTVVGNHCYDDQGVKTQDYGYAEYGSATAMSNNTIADNYFTGNALAPINQGASNPTVRTTFRGPQIVSVGHAATPGSLIADANYIVTSTVIGARLGDAVKVAFTQQLQGVSLEASVIANDTVAAVFCNNNNVGTKVLVDGTLNYLVEKPINYGTY